MDKTNVAPAPKAPLTPEEIFAIAAKQAAARARDINKSVRDFTSGDSEVEDLMLEVQLGHRKLSKALASLAQAHKVLSEK